MRLSIFLLILSAFACETKEHAEDELGALKKAQSAAAKVAARASAGVEEDIGIPECDTYIRKYEACLAEKVPDEAQRALRNTLDEQRKQWRESAKDNFARAALPDQCRSASAAAKQTMGAYGCDF